MVEKILNNTTPYGKIRASHEGLLRSSTLSIHTKFEQPRLYSSCYILPTRIQVPEFFVKAQ